MKAAMAQLQGWKRAGGLFGILVAAILWTGCQSIPRTSALTLQDLDGREHPLSGLTGSRGLVLVFVGVDCPIANRALPEITAIERRMEARGIRVVLVYANAAETRQQVRAHLAEYSLTLPAYRDPGFVVAKRYGAHVTPEAVVLTPAGQQVYRGRINDQSSALGRDRPVATSHDLSEALEAFLATGAVSGRVVPAVGCTFRSP